MVFLLVFGLLNIGLSTVMSAPITNEDSQADPKWIDLSYPFIQNETIYWPIIKNFTIKRLHWGPYPGTKDGVFVTFSNFEAGEHGGTHMDAPIHFFEKGLTIGQVPLESTIGQAVVINISAKAEKDRDYQMNVSDLEEWEKQYGRIPNRSIVFLYTGIGRFYPNKEKYFGTKTPDDPDTFHFPGMTVEAARWLINKRNFKLYGVDAASLDAASSKNRFPVHVELSRHNIAGIENVANLHLLPPRGAEVFAAPMKTRDGSGGPCRLFARIVDKEVVKGGTAPRLSSGVISILLGAVYTMFF